MTENENYSSFAYRDYRNISLGLKIKVLIGGTMTQVGWMLVAFGMIFVIVFVGNADFSSLYLGGNSPQAEGTITEVLSTNSEVNDRDVYACHYTFKASDGQTIEGVSYTTGRLPVIGEKVTILYLSNNPQYSKIQGMGKGTFPPFVLFVLVFPLIGFVFALSNIKNALLGIRLLQHGVITRGKMIGMQPTSTTINNRPVMKVFFEFKADDGQTYQTYASTHLTENLTDEQEELLFYDPNDPSKAVVKDGLPGRPTILEDGSLEFVGIHKALIYLIAPAIALLEIYFFLKWML